MTPSQDATQGEKLSPCLGCGQSFVRHFKPLRYRAEHFVCDICKVTFHVSLDWWNNAWARKQSSHQDKEALARQCETIKSLESRNEDLKKAGEFIQEEYSERIEALKKELCKQTETIKRLEREAKNIPSIVTMMNRNAEMEGELSKKEGTIKALVEVLERISTVSQFNPRFGQIVDSEHYEGAWLECVGIAVEAMAKAKEIL